MQPKVPTGAPKSPSATSNLEVPLAGADIMLWSPEPWAPPTSTSKNNPCTTGLPPIPKTPPKIESDVAPPSRNSGTSGPGESHFIEKTTTNSFVSSVAEIVSLPTCALMLGPQTLNIGQKVTYVGETYSLGSNGDFTVGSQTLDPGQQITDSGTTYPRASDGPRWFLERAVSQVPKCSTRRILYNRPLLLIPRRSDLAPKSLYREELTHSRREAGLQLLVGQGRK
ncbi:hypothetical protein BGZ57DRAFT_900708 [Hyaloscypha finlandica]|nr:hypothetical protein BGZ57DRAFT_900708 [Hyaloscypha finlandica]